MRCLVLACSATKRPDPGLLPAHARYDGPPWRILRAYRARVADPGLAVFALSGEFGLIPADEPIPDYERRMDAARAAALLPQLRPAVAALFARHPRAYGVMGADYARALAWTGAVPPGALALAAGGIGAKNGALKRWLDGGAP